jgi:repressor LexA
MSTAPESQFHPDADLPEQEHDQDISAAAGSLPPGQGKILALFADAEDAGMQPSRGDIAKAVGYAFPSAVTKHVEALVRKGYLIADRTRKRNVSLTDAGWAVIGRTPARKGVPVLGSIAAGTPILAADNLNGFLADLVPAPGRFALHVRGDSMIDAGINDGDYAVIQKGSPVADGRIGAVRVGEEATLKRVRYRPGQLELIAENKAYAPRIVDTSRSDADVEVVGPLVCIYRQVR